ncbi:rod shape-determining protein MreC [Streptomyces sp. TLI_105]|uniref:rod shape-determining protein MreC n=1 Tax=Streptomyces sp. TLI_105 TaxID=1881019 RepID=UPI00089473F3|nr:rod shape-determining protein MreC [Streptomyces sp. TLI_105]SEE11879.1 rod shape-determining protein MreB [Streptomyces sp. TLI_105]
MIDPDSQLRLLRRLAASAPGGDGHDTVVMLTRPVLAGPRERAAAKRMVDGLDPVRVIAVDSARAAAAYAAPPDGGPLLVVDLGAQLTEVTLVVDGLVEDARQAEVGPDDLPEPGSGPDAIATTTTDMVSGLWRHDRTGAVRGALRRGVLVTGGGALRLDVTGRLAHLLRARLRLAEDPSTRVVRGAGLMPASAPATRPAPSRAADGRVHGNDAQGKDPGGTARRGTTKPRLDGGFQPGPIAVTGRRAVTSWGGPWGPGPFAVTYI